MIKNLLFFVTLLGYVPLFTGCGFCICKETKCQKKSIPVAKKELHFTSPSIQAASLPVETPAPRASTPEIPVTMPEVPASQEPAKKVLGIEVKSEEEFKQHIQTPTIMYFTASWCRACDKMNKMFNQVSQELAGQYKFVWIDVDKFRSLATETYGLTAIPTIMFLDQNKELTTVGRLISSDVTKEQFVQTIKMAFQGSLQK